MKKQFFLFIEIAFCLTMNAESFAKTYVELYKGKTIKVKKMDINMGGYSNFYAKFDTKNMTLDRRNPRTRLYPTNSVGLYSSTDQLLGTEWVVSNIYQENYVDYAGVQYYVLELVRGKNKAYYEYDPVHKYKLEFIVVGGLDLPTDFYCQDIEIIKDKFNDKTTYTHKKLAGIDFSRIDVNVEGVGLTTFYFLHSNAAHNTCVVGERGFYILFDNGQKIEKPEAELKVDVNPSGKSFVYSTIISLTEEDIQLLLNHKMTDKRTYIFDDVICLDDAEILQEYLRCLINR